MGYRKIYINKVYLRINLRSAQKNLGGGKPPALSILGVPRIWLHRLADQPPLWYWTNTKQETQKNYVTDSYSHIHMSFKLNWIEIYCSHALSLTAA